MVLIKNSAGQRKYFLKSIKINTGTKDHERTVIWKQSSASSEGETGAVSSICVAAVVLEKSVFCDARAALWRAAAVNIDSVGLSQLINSLFADTNYFLHKRTLKQIK